MRCEGRVDWGRVNDDLIQCADAESDRTDDRYMKPTNGGFMRGTIPRNVRNSTSYLHICQRINLTS